MLGLGFIKKSVSKLWIGIGSKLKQLFASSENEKLNVESLRTILLENDVGVSVCDKIIESLEKNAATANLPTLKKVLHKNLVKLLTDCPPTPNRPKVVMLVGVNGAGKTTFAAKFANLLKREGKNPVLVAADTFRAAAGKQLKEWAMKTNTPLIEGRENQDPASVVYKGAGFFRENQCDHLIIDTAGRLHTKSNLMAELAKIKKVLAKKLGPDIKISTWLVLDSMLGQSSTNQAEVFHSATTIDGLVLTKCDGAAKGGAIFTIAYKFNLPVVFTTNGQDLDDLKDFNPEEYVNSFLE